MRKLSVQIICMIFFYFITVVSFRNNLFRKLVRASGSFDWTYICCNLWFLLTRWENWCFCPKLCHFIGLILLSLVSGEAIIFWSLTFDITTYGPFNKRVAFFFVFLFYLKLFSLQYMKIFPTEIPGLYSIMSKALLSSFWNLDQRDGNQGREAKCIFVWNVDDIGALLLKRDFNALTWWKWKFSVKTSGHVGMHVIIKE